MKRLLLLPIFWVNICNGFVDPVSLGIAGGLAALGYNYETVGKYTVCRFVECCNDDYIPANFNELKADLQRNLYGQHIVIQELMPAIRGHFSKDSKPKKPLVISFHGTPGTGKNYVADFIAKNLYKKGVESKFVHKFLGRSDFPSASLTDVYKERVNMQVRNAIKECPRSLFIFDEVDKMPPGVFDAIESLLDHHSFLNGYDFSRSIFIFLSNTAGLEIADKLTNIMKTGELRENAKLHDFEKIIELNAYNQEGGLKKASVIETHLVDHFIPFLPLEKDHIRKCIETEFRRLGTYNPSDETVNQILDNYVTYESSGLFAITGCKRISKKVEVEVYKRYGY